MTPAKYYGAQLVATPRLPIPTGKRVPFGWKTATVSRDILTLAWPQLPQEVLPTHFRFTIGLDERDEKTVQVVLPQSGRVLGAIELRFVSQFQLYEFALTAEHRSALRTEGLGLQLTQGSDLEIFTEGKDLPEPLCPHLLVPGTQSALTEFHARLASLASVQQFGWMEGCVLDGLLDLGELKSARAHLALFFKNGKLIYENHLSVPSDGVLYGIEGGLPFAALARLEPENPLLELAVAFWRSRLRPSGLIQDGIHLSTEGTYTIGYALAEIAQARRSEELMLLALQQVRLRQSILFDGQELWRTKNDDGVRTNRNWARGIAWQLLGTARTLTAAKQRKDTEDIIQGLRQLSDWAISYQRADGLWSVFVDEQKLTPDTGGSAGIAAALALGVKHGWLDREARRAAEKAHAGIEVHLTTDGFLSGVSQSNKGGEGLQRSHYRSIYQMGMGLFGQLIAALRQS